MANNYTLGRGRLYFAQYLLGTQTPKGERYFGNTPDLNLTIESENLDHFSSDRGIREKDDSVPLQTNRTGSFSTDNIDPANLALFFFGTSGIATQASGTVTDEPVTDVEIGLFYQLGSSQANPAGVRDITTVTVSKAAGGALVENIDYKIDLALARVEILKGGAIVNGDDLVVDYTKSAKSREFVVSGGTPIEGQLRFVADNPRGNNYDYLMPWVKVSANGDFALKGDEWQVIPFNLEVLRKTGYEAIYIDGRAFTPAA